MRYFRRKGLNDAEAQDFVQETLVRIIQKGGVERFDNPQGYVFTIAANLLRDRARRVGHRARESHIGLEGVWLTSDTPSADRQLAGREELARIKAAILALPKKPQRVFILHRFEELTYREIAELMGVSRSSVEKYMMTALARLKQVRDKSS